MRRPQAYSQLASVALWTLWLAENAAARSWIDCIDHNYDAVYTKSDDWVRGGLNGQGACEAYGYNYPGHGDDNHNNEYAWKINANNILDDSTSVCQYKQKDARYNEWRRPVRAQPGDKLYMGYMSNGHIVRDEDRVATTWGVYWSGKAGIELTKPSELTPDRLVDGKLNAFDDGNCGASHTTERQASGRAGDSKPCVGSFSVPSDAKPGRYQMVWYWTAFQVHGETKLEDRAAYTTCFDVIVGDDKSDAENDPQRLGCGVEDDGEESAAPALVHAPIEILPPVQQTPAAVLAPVPTTAVPPTPVTTTVSPPPVTTTAPPSIAPVAAARAFSPTSLAASPTNSPFSAPLATVTYNGVGGSGMYGKVTAMQCPSSNTCTQSDFAVSGPLAPFDEDLTLTLRGPLDVDGISVFTSVDANTWSQTSSYSKASRSSQNMVFLNNKGDPLKSGVFDMCDGNSQSYATADGQTAASSATAFSGVLDDGVEINVMSSTSCAQSGTCGVTRGVAHEGWAGNNKIFMVKARMPMAPTGGKDLPAIWLLNGQIVRTAQYGCNCRGMGDFGKWKGGCGEIDVAEVLTTDHTALTSTIYSFKGSRGTSAFAPRPVDDAVVFVVVLSQQTTTGSTDLGMAQILVMKPEDVDMATPPSQAQVEQWLAYRNGVQVDFDI